MLSTHALGLLHAGTSPGEHLNVDVSVMDVVVTDEIVDVTELVVTLLSVTVVVDDVVVDDANLPSIAQFVFHAFDSGANPVNSNVWNLFASSISGHAFSPNTITWFTSEPMVTSIQVMSSKT